MAKGKVSDVPTEIARLIAAEKGAGATVPQLMETHKLNRYTVNRILDMPESRAIIEEADGQLYKAAIALLRSAIYPLIPKAVKALERGLEKGDIKAVHEFFEVLGVNQTQKDGGSKQGQVLQVILPDYNKPKEVPHDDG